MDIYSIALIVLIPILLLLVVYDKAKKKNPNRRKTLNSYDSKFYIFLLEKVYVFLSQNLFTSTPFNALNNKLYMNQNTVEKKLKIKSIYYFVGYNSIIVIGCIIPFFLGLDLFYILLGALLGMISKNYLMDFFVGDELMLLLPLRDFIDNLCYNYGSLNSCVDALQQCMYSTDSSVALHVKRMFHAIQDPREFEFFIKDCPNIYLVRIMKSINLVSEYGDTITPFGSKFVIEMKNLSNEVQLDIERRDNLSYKIKILPFLCVAPLSCIFLIPKFVLYVSPIATYFYSSFFDIIVRCITLIICILTYNKLKSLMVFDTSYSYTISSGESLEIKLLAKFSWLRAIIRKAMPKRTTKLHTKLTKLIFNSGEFISIDIIYVRRIIYFLIGFVLTIILCFTAINMEKHSVLEGFGLKFTDLNSTVSIDGALVPQYDVDKAILASITGDFGTTKEYFVDSTKLMAYFMNYGITKEDDVAAGVERLNSKLDYYNSLVFNPLYILICLMVAYGVSWMPVRTLSHNANKIKDSMASEVHQYKSIIMFLMDYPQSSIDLILEWLIKFSNVFKLPLVIAKNSLSSGSLNALDDLKLSISYKPMVRLIDGLKRCDKLPTCEAFKSLVNDRESLERERIEINDRIVKNRYLIAQNIYGLPTKVMFVLYGLAPLAWVALTQLMLSFDQISQF